MSIEQDLKRLADAAEGILAVLTNTEAPTRKPGRPSTRKSEVVDPAPADPIPNPALPDAKPAAAMEQVAAPVTTVPTVSNVVPIKPAAEISPQDLQKAVSLKVGEGKREAVLAIITAAGVDRASAVPEAQRSAVLAALNAL